MNQAIYKSITKRTLHVLQRCLSSLSSSISSLDKKLSEKLTKYQWGPPAKPGDVDYLEDQVPRGPLALPVPTVEIPNSVGQIPLLEDDLGKKNRHNKGMKTHPSYYHGQSTQTYRYAANPQRNDADVFNEHRDTLVVPKSLDLNSIQGPRGDLIRRLDVRGKLIRLDYLYAPAIVKH